jgi:hypothetical protein
MSCTIKNIFSLFSIKVLAYILPTYFQWPLVQKKEREDKEGKKFLAQALACLMSIVVSFVFALCD